MRTRDEEQQIALNAIRDDLSKGGMALCVCATGYAEEKVD